jgi:amino acid transporter
MPEQEQDKPESLIDQILGRPLAWWDAEQQQIGVLTGIPCLGLDALSSAAYGPEAALMILAPLGLAGVSYIGPITAAILAVLAVVYFSYRQTIAAYPNGGGSYIVAKHNLGTQAGLFAAAALLLDYVLNVAVGISAGIGALVSAVPALHEHVLTLCLITLAIIAVINLRGLRESGLAFGVPTFAFLATLGGVLVIGAARVLLSHGHPVPVVPPPPAPPPMAAVGLWLLLRSFASGCTAMTGVEAVSNAVPAFEEPRVKKAQRTLTAIVVILAVLLAGIAWLSRVYGIVAMDQTRPGYQNILSQLVAAVIGHNVVYYFAIASILAVLAFSANTSFADFPRVCRLVSEDGFLPHAFANVGRRLVYSNGIVVLTILSAVLLIAFGGITDRLIPLFAVGAFTAFTLSQAGMVVHWKRAGSGHRGSLAVNSIGAVATTAALAIIIVAKFAEGAWITLLLIPGSVALFHAVRRHYKLVARQIDIDRPLDLTTPRVPPIVVIPIKDWNTVTEKALRFGMTISKEIIAVRVLLGDEDGSDLKERWERFVAAPSRDAGLPPPHLVLLPSPYRRLFKPIIDFVNQLRRQPGQSVAVIIPDLVEARWWESLLHNHRADVLKALLFLRGGQDVVTISVPWYLRERGSPARTRRPSRSASNQ